MKQINKAMLIEGAQDRDPNWCVFCDLADRCSSCDAIDFYDKDCGTCDLTREEN